MKKTKIILLILLLTIFCLKAFASQNPTQLPTSSPYAGLTMLNNINSALNTFQTNFSGATAPSTTTDYQYWVNTSASTLNFYDGTNWLPMGQWSGSQWTPISNGVINTIPASTGSSNVYVVTYSPVPTALITGQHYPFIANFQNTSAATENVNSLGAKAIKKRGGTALASADIVSGAVVDTVYDGTNFQMLSQVGNASSGTITSIATNNGLTGGTITTSGTIGLASIGTSFMLANPTIGSAVPVGTTLSSFIDYSFSGSAQGTTLYRGATGWTSLAPGTNGQPLLTGGASANASWGQLPIAAISASGTPSSTTFLSGDGSWASPPSPIVTPFNVGSIIMACVANYAPGSLTPGQIAPSSDLFVLNFSGVGSGGSPSFSADTITGNWQALQTVINTGGANCVAGGPNNVGLFQRVN